MEATKTTIKTGTTGSAVVSETVIVEKPAQIKEIVERPAVVQETIHSVEVEEVQPVVHREINKTEVHEITQPIFEKQVKPTVDVSGTNATIVRETINKNTEKIVEDFEGAKREILATDKATVVKPTLVEETIKTDVVEIVQPVVHLDTHEKMVIHTTQPIVEKVIEQATVIHETRAPIVRETTIATPM